MMTQMIAQELALENMRASEELQQQVRVIRRRIEEVRPLFPRAAEQLELEVMAYEAALKVLNVQLAACLPRA